MSVVIETTLGDVTVDLFTEERPQTCLNFLKLCKIKYYNLCLFHSVSANFLAQTGDPSGKGDGGESIFGLLKGSEHRLFLGEKMPKIKHDRTGLLSMVSHGDGLFGSQFIITLSGNLTSLDQEHCVFGHIIEGVELLLKLNEAITDDQHRPYQDIRITHTVILEDPFPDPEGLVVPLYSPVPPSTKDLAFSRIPADEPLNENYSQEELDEMVQQKEAAARAAILEMVGDIPNADVAPPENVLFVCKLNPLTSDHDLSLIFSRFGTVKSCEVIRDQVTGDSLQYAFIEFEDKKACEDAYFKMDNVLIDDRRIHVDFSQSVAKLKWRGKGKGVEYLGPPPLGGWVNRNKSSNSRDAEINVTSMHDKKRTSNGANFRHKNYFQNGRTVRKENKIRCDKEKSRNHERQNLKKKLKIMRKKSSSISTSSDSISETSDSSSSYSSSTSSCNKRKKHKKSRKVLVVVKTPSRGGSGKKLKKSKTKSKKQRKFETESDSCGSIIIKRKNKKKGRKETTSSDSSESSSDESLRKRRKKKEYSTSDEELRIKTKRKKISETSDSSSSSSCKYEKFEMERGAKKKIRSRKNSCSSSDTDSDQSNKRKKSKVKSKKKKLIKKKKKKALITFLSV